MVKVISLSTDEMEDEFERDLLILCDWDYAALDSIDESVNGVEWLNGKTCKGNFIYKPTKGRIDYDKELIH